MKLNSLGRPAVPEHTRQQRAEVVRDATDRVGQPAARTKGDPAAIKRRAVRRAVTERNSRSERAVCPVAIQPTKRPQQPVFVRGHALAVSHSP